MSNELYNPDNPRAWDPNHASLKSPLAPHETAGVLRVQRTGRGGAELMKIFKLRGTKLMAKLQRAMNDEAAAHRAGLNIHDALIKGDK